MRSRLAKYRVSSTPGHLDRNFSEGRTKTCMREIFYAGDGMHKLARKTPAAADKTAEKATPGKLDVSGEYREDGYWYGKAKIHRDAW
jgi:hypothetical protein